MKNMKFHLFNYCFSFFLASFASLREPFLAKAQSAQRAALLFLLLFAGASLAKAGDPGWSVTPGNFQYSMTFTSIANEACVELANSNNKVGAFVGGVCRGVVQTNVVSGGRNYASWSFTAISQAEKK